MIPRARIASFERAKRLYFNTVEFDEKKARRLLKPGSRALMVKAVAPYSLKEMEDDRQHILGTFSEKPLLCALVATKPESHKGLEGLPVPSASPGGRYTSFGRYVTRAEVPGLYESLNEQNALSAVHCALGLVFDNLRWCGPARRWRDDVFATTTSILARKRNSCASWANLSASLLRSLRIPARLAYGGTKRMGEWVSHAWVEVDFGKRWVAFDPVNQRGGYSLDADYVKLFTCADWGDLDFSAYRAFTQRTGWWPPFEIKEIR